MSNPRKKYSDAQNVALLSQVNRVCPLCAEPLFYQKGGRSYKNYEIAHIYPLNPTPDEILLLKGEERLSSDVNDEDNVIPLCEICHGKFDKPRTVDEYRELLKLKKGLIDRSGQEAIWKRYAIEKEIGEVIESIYKAPDFENDTEIEFDPKEINKKLDDTISQPTKRKIKNNVREYFMFISTKLSELDNAEGDLSEMISLQVKTYYLKQKRMGLQQQAIFDNIVLWIHMKTKPKTNDAAEILASFFVQNCEVF
ncbi:HNH endonuclease [Colwellia sp. MB02u-18]|uniref:ABC-three component system protein n=1 Tax=unclassified Colwellia TaxID=196834 RepID=UPI0015F4A82E|nr:MULTISPECIES: ABC-three component system protein [unclassified Colwellia]MBA6224734.1 HNH endonuclease [Colwellia sp. MB3u-45]MBA6266814.1 HNH endonuclease [Colwellia sp. MB3u-43]MBA6321409.1 HNH endonuclease [Colwellia sp. MB02u-19]MBA6323616.1 HNH endonuclease [Colwellia sp. MB02u-18]MBA6332437.1 HNH endonuclease [Colwellia sp. MB02u-12]